jgi:hypothetical protein
MAIPTKRYERNTVSYLDRDRALRGVRGVDYHASPPLEGLEQGGLIHFEQAGRRSSTGRSPIRDQAGESFP